jgi:uncharacterized membrane protein YccC
MDKELAWIKAHGADWRLAVRVTVACLATFALATFFHLAQGYWAVFTAIIVTQSSVGGSLTTGIDRLIGTVGGVAYSAFIATTMPQGSTLDLAMAMGAALLPLAFLAALNPSFRIAPVTAVILLLAPSHGAGPVVSAVDRVLEILLGTVAGIMVSLVIFPARAHGLLGKATADTLMLYVRLLATLAERARGVEGTEVSGRFAVIRQSINKAETLAKEAKRERDSRLTTAPDPAPIARTLRRLRSDLVILDRTLATPLPPSLKERLVTEVTAVIDATVDFLTAAALALRQNQPPPSLDGVETAVRNYAGLVSTLRKEEFMRDLSDEQVSRIFTLGFALDQMRQNFRDLVGRIAEFAKR